MVWGLSRRRRTPTVLQMEAAECGAAALGIVLAHFGRWVTLEELRVACNVSRDGSSAAAIVRAARHHGMQVAAQRMEPAHLRTNPMPAIVHWGMNHFLVVEGVGRGVVYLNDPAQGPRTVSNEEFDRNFTGIVLTLTPGADFVPSGHKPSIRRALESRMQGTRGALAFVLALSAVLIVPGLLVPVFTQVFVDQVLVNHFDSWLMPLLAGMGICAVVHGLLVWLQRDAMLRFETRVALLGGLRFVNHVVRLPMAYFAQRHPGDVSSRVMLNDRIAQLAAGDIGLVLFNLITASAYLAAMTWYAPRLAAVVLLFALVSLGILSLLSRALADDNRRLLSALTMQTGFAKQGLQMVEGYKANGTEDHLRGRLVSMNARVMNLRQALATRQVRLTALPRLVATAAGGIVLVLGGNMVVAGDLTIGMLVAFQALMAGFMSPVGQLVQLGSKIQDGQAYLQMVNDTMQHPLATEFTDRPAGDGGKARPAGKLEVRNLSFSYSPGVAPLLDGISFTLAPGRRLGIVGASGSGKSTLASLLAGLLQPNQGEILIDDRNIAEMPRAAFRQALAYVDQRSAIFQGTVRDNISLWDPSLPDDRLIAAARLALIHDTILQRPGGYGAAVAEGGTDLSGGQRARLELTRALVRDPRLLILDEATAALDSNTEAALFRHLRGMGATLVVIAHRLTAVRDCDEIIVLEKGRIVQQGDPEVLIGMAGPFRTLMTEEDA